LTFNQQLDPARAEDVSEYQLVGPRGRIDPIISAVYDPATQTVTLHPKRRVNLHRTYRLTVDGTGVGGLTDVQGLLLNSTSTQPGSNYDAKLDWRNVVWPDPRRKTARRDKSTIVSAPTKSLNHHETKAARLFSRSFSIPAAAADQALSRPRLRSIRVHPLANRAL
jgi:type VI secretion system secreted protein VgrG